MRNEEDVVESVTQRARRKNASAPERSQNNHLLAPVVCPNLGFNFNPGFFFFCSKAFSRIIFSLLFR